MRLHIYFILMVFQACSPAVQQSASAKKTGLSTKNASGSDTGTSTDLSAAPIVKVDASKLRISEVSVGKMTEGGKRSEVVNFTTWGQGDYVHWQICPEDPPNDGVVNCVPSDTQACGLGGACVQNVTSYNKILFPHLYAGNVSISMKFCVDPERAMDSKVVCGDSTVYPYNSRAVNADVQALFLKRQGLLDAINKIGVEKRQDYQNYANDLQDCLDSSKQNEAYYQSKIQTINQLIKGVFWNMFIWAPKSVWKAMQETENGSKLTQGLTSALSATKDAFSDMGKKFCDLGATQATDESCLSNLKDAKASMTQAQIDAFCSAGLKREKGMDGFCKLMGTLGDTVSTMIQSADPMQSFSVLSDAIHTVSDPSGSVAKQCTAEEKFAKVSQGSDMNLSALGQQLSEVNAQLRALGEL